MTSATRSKQSFDVADMNNQHLIDNVIFDTTYSERVVAFEQRSEIDDFVKNNLMNVIDEVFDKVDRDAGIPDSVFRIDKLEIDLGDIPYHDFRQQIPRKLREQLLSALREARYSASKKPLSIPGLVDSKSDAQAQLFYYLRNGYLPWYSRLTDPNALESLLIETIDSTPAALIEFMRDTVQRARVLERLTKQFSKPTVQRVMGLLPSSGTTENDRADNVDDLEAEMVSALLTGDAELIESALQAFYDVHSESLPLSGVTESNRLANVDNLVAQLVSGLLSADTALIESAWQVLYAEHSQLLNKILRHFGQQAIVRHNIASSFPPALFDELLRLLEPAARDLVQLLLDHADIFQPVDEQQAGARSRQITELRAFTLTYLLDERGSRFSKRSYLASLLRQMSASSNRSRPLLFDRLMENTDRLSRSNKLAGDMSRLLTGLAAEMTAQMTSGKDSSLDEATGQQASDKDLLSTEVTAQLEDDKDLPLSEAENQAGPHEQYQRLKSALTLAGAGRAYSDSSLLEDIKSLARDNPHLLMRLFHELKAGGHPWRQAIENLSTPVLAELGYALLSLNKQSDKAISSDPGSDLLSAIHSNAEKSQDRQAFFIHILSCLINDEVIDFSAIRFGAPFGIKPVATSSDRTDSVNKAEQAVGPPDSVPSTTVDAGEPDQGQNEEPAPLENIYIANAGAVLFAPYLPRLFERLGLVDQGKFKNRDAAEHGVHCVQFLVNESTSSPEYQLVLNKLLCGVKPGLPIRRSIELAAGEHEQLEALLHAITQHWKPLANTSIAGLRESFLQRNGRLQLKRDAWHLSVEARPFDMLLDQIPWSYSTIKFPWMDRVIYVEWR